MVLHHVTNDAKLIKVTATPLGTKGLFEGDGDRVNGVSVPDRLEDGVGKSEITHKEKFCLFVCNIELPYLKTSRFCTISFPK